MEREGYHLDWGLRLVRFGEKSAIGESLAEVAPKTGQEQVKFVRCCRSFVFNAVSTAAIREKKGGGRVDIFPTGISHSYGRRRRS